MCRNFPDFRYNISWSILGYHRTRGTCVLNRRQSHDRVWVTNSIEMRLILKLQSQKRNLTFPHALGEARRQGQQDQVFELPKFRFWLANELVSSHLSCKLGGPKNKHRSLGITENQIMYFIIIILSIRDHNRVRHFVVFRHDNLGHQRMSISRPGRMRGRTEGEKERER